MHLRRILVATDFSDSAHHALRYGVSFAKQFEAVLVLAHAVENMTLGYASDLFPVPMAEVFEEISGLRRTELAKLAAEVREKGRHRRRACRAGQAPCGDREPRFGREGRSHRPRHPRQGDARPGALRIDNRTSHTQGALSRPHRQRLHTADPD